MIKNHTGRKCVCESEDVSQDLLGFGYLEMMFSINLRACSLSVCDNQSFVLDVVPGITKPGVLSLEWLEDQNQRSPHPKSLKKLQSTNAKIPPCLPGRSGTDSLLSECVTTTLCPVSAPLTGKARCGSGAGCSTEAPSPYLCLLVGLGVQGCL